MAAPKKQWPVLKARYLEHLKALNYAERTIESIESHLRFFLDYLENETKAEDLASLSYEDLSAYQNWLYFCEGSRGKKSVPLSVATQLLRLSALMGFFRYLFKQGIIFTDPAASLEQPKRRKALPRGILTGKQVLALMGAPDTKTSLGLRDRAILELLYATGMRNEELRSLRKIGRASCRERV